MQEMADKLELHYYLNNESHVMDALVRNKCEAELLAIIFEVSDLLGIEVNIETGAYQEGGLKEVWAFIGRNNNQLTLLLTLLIVILSRVPLSDPEQEALTKEETKLTIEEKRLSIEKLKRELKDGEVKKETTDAASNAISGNLKVAARKSNFYKNLAGYEKVTGVGMLPLDKYNQPTADEKYIPRSDFRNFILFTNNLPTEVIEDAQIEIISPVLKEGNYKWKGMYQFAPISFTMNDSEFKDSVLREEISFQHGSIIECVLSIHREFDEIGDVKITGYSVTTVIRKTDGASTLETIQGKRYKAHKKFTKDQQNLF
jgi:hypothetical protein